MIQRIPIVYFSRVRLVPVKEMAMDIKKTIDDLVNKIKLDKVLSDLFSKDPLKAVQELVGEKIPKEQLESIVEGVKAKISVDKAGDALNKVKGLFGG